MAITDEDTALQAMATLETLSAEQQDALRAVNAILHNGEPFVNVHELFGHYSVLYFRKLLMPRVEVLWSPRLTLCAGICELSKDPSTANFTRIRLKLSTPLLQYRPRSDTVNTLLHEAIHAYFFITTSWKHSRGDDGTGHGVGFRLFADAINNHGNYNITVYHTFHDEVESFRTHVWQCNGPCNTQHPFFGLVKRSMNRAPGKGDNWWSKHEAECGGTYTKIQEPAPTKKQLEALSKKERAGRQKNKLDGWVTAQSKKAPDTEGKTLHQPSDEEEGDRSRMSSNNPRNVQAKAADVSPNVDSSFSPAASQKRARTSEDEANVPTIGKKMLVECPICNVRIAESDINQHLDVVHSLCAS